ncbi:hypothetical protein AURDEDRAFT_161653 [Auricularia subglabra TFB-10046 SS5]|nr:hypothetical protein AURDEDRAFT_161653 [Auricularia subglabra TFB-10046 SS5]
MVHELARDHLDRRFCFGQQNPVQVELVCRKAQAKLDPGTEFAGNWPIKDFLRIYLHNTSRAYRVKLKKGAVLSLAERAFARVDASGTGKLDCDVLLAYFKKSGLARREDKADVNKDGWLTTFKFAPAFGMERARADVQSGHRTPARNEEDKCHRDLPPLPRSAVNACTDRLDRLNKELSHRDRQYYMGVLRQLRTEDKMTALVWPARSYYVVQAAHVDPAKGTPHLIASYLLVFGHGAVDNPDALSWAILQNTDAKNDVHNICVMRLPPSDPLLNALMSNVHGALQFSSREGFEVQVAEAIRITATRTGGIPLQVQHGKSDILVEVNDSDAVARHL